MIAATNLFESKLLTLQGELLKFAMKLTSDPDDANDLLQETTLRALDNQEKYTHETNFKGWLFTIMRNIFSNNFHRLANRSWFTDGIESIYHTLKGKEYSHEESDDSCNISAIQTAIEGLPSEYKEPFSMYISGFKYKEIAETMNLPLGTIKSRIFLTRQKLQKDLKDFL